MRMSRVIGHRGLAGEAPENTLAGIRLAGQQGLEWVELDVSLLGDETPVLFHDRRLNRTTDRKGRLSSLTRSRLPDIDAGSWFSQRYAGEKIPTLVEALTLIKALGLGLNLELKTNGCSPAALVTKVLQVIEDVSFAKDRLVISSFNYQALVYLSSRSDIDIACLFERLPLAWQEKARRVNAVSIHIDSRRISHSQATRIKAAGYELYCFTVNGLTEFERLMQLGVDGVFSDWPGSLLAGR